MVGNIQSHPEKKELQKEMPDLEIAEKQCLQKPYEQLPAECTTGQLALDRDTGKQKCDLLTVTMKYWALSCQNTPEHPHTRTVKHTTRPQVDENATLAISQQRLNGFSPLTIGLPGQAAIKAQSRLPPPGRTMNVGGPAGASSWRHSPAHLSRGVLALPSVNVPSDRCGGG